MSDRPSRGQEGVHESCESFSRRYRPEIDGLRAFAVVAVIINHFNKDILPGGYLGVDIFFVISGYVITSSLFERTAKSFKDFISAFYERRIKRLVPALSVFVLILSIAICLFNPSPERSLETGLTSLFGLSNLYLLKQSTDYFAQPTELNVFTHTWSLGVEEQFYIIFPFLIWLSGFGQQTKNGARNLLVIVGTLTIASLIGFLYLYPTNQSAAYFLMPSRFWEISAGCLIFIELQKKGWIEKSLSKVAPLLLLSLIVGVMYLPMSMGAVSTVAVVALSSILLASLKSHTAAFRVFTNPKVIYLGLISYSLYLWHWGVLSISRWTIGIHWWSVPFQVALILGLAVVSYRWIEMPLRKSNWFGKRSKILVIGGGILLTFSGGLISMLKIRIDGLNPSQHLYLLANPELVVGSPEHLKDRKVILAADAWSSINNDSDTRNFAKCHFSKPVARKDFHKCLGYTSKVKNKIYILGDSHASNYAFGIRKAFPKRVFMATVGWGCGILGPDESKLFDNSNMNCSDYNNYAIDLANSVMPGEAFIVVNDWTTGSIKKSSRNQKRIIEDIAKRVSSRGASFILLDDVPGVGDPFIETKRWYRPLASGKVAVNAINDMQSDLDLIGQSVSSLSPLIHYLPLRHLLCDESFCGFEKNGVPIYFNNGHITIQASEDISEQIKTYMNDIGIY